MMEQNELKFARTGFMKNILLNQEEFTQKQNVIIKEIIENASPKHQQRIRNIYGSLEAYASVLKELTDHEVDIQKGLVEMMMEKLELDNEVKCVILEQMYGENNVCYEEAEYVDDDDYDDEYIDDDDYEDEYVDDDDEEEYIDDDEDEDDYYDEEDEEDEYIDDEYDDDDEYVDDDGFEEEIYYECMECYMFEDDERYDMPIFQEKLEMIRKILDCRITEAEETKLCLDMGMVLDMPGSLDATAVKEVPVEFSYEMKSAAINICKRLEKLPQQARTVQAKSKALISEIARKSKEDSVCQHLVEELIEKGSEYQLQRLFLNLEK